MQRDNFHKSRDYKLEDKLPEDVLLRIGMPPKRPIKAYEIYLRDNTGLIKKQYPDMKHKDIMLQLCDEWLHKLNDRDKDVYCFKEREEDKSYRDAFAEYNKKKKIVLDEYYQKLKEQEEAKIKVKFKTAFKLFKLDQIA